MQRSEEKDNEVENFFRYLEGSMLAGYHRSPIVPATIPDNSIENDFEQQSKTMFALRNLLPKDVHRFFRYSGSLTTPECGEVVQWTVFINRFHVSNETVRPGRSVSNLGKKFN